MNNLILFPYHDETIKKCKDCQRDDCEYFKVIEVDFHNSGYDICTIHAGLSKVTKDSKKSLYTFEFVCERFNTEEILEEFEKWAKQYIFKGVTYSHNRCGNECDVLHYIPKNEHDLFIYSDRMSKYINAKTSLLKAIYKNKM